MTGITDPLGRTTMTGITQVKRWEREFSKNYPLLRHICEGLGTNCSVLRFREDRKRSGLTTVRQIGQWTRLMWSLPPRT